MDGETMNKRQLRANFRKYLFGYTFEAISPAKAPDSEDQPTSGDQVLGADLDQPSPTSYTDARELADGRSRSPY